MNIGSPEVSLVLVCMTVWTVWLSWNRQAHCCLIRRQKVVILKWCSKLCDWKKRRFEYHIIWSCNILHSSQRTMPSVPCRCHFQVYTLAYTSTENWKSWVSTVAPRSNEQIVLLGTLYFNPDLSFGQFSMEEYDWTLIHPTLESNSRLQHPFLLHHIRWIRTNLQ